MPPIAMHWTASLQVVGWVERGPGGYTGLGDCSETQHRPAGQPKFGWGLTDYVGFRYVLENQNASLRPTQPNLQGPQKLPGLAASQKPCQ
jgi:hypothetical protein